jgi:anaerobic ribonucleoside-triphosphate reductase activating protein
MGGEPLCPENEFLTCLLIIEVRKRVPDVPIYIWTGYTIEELARRGGKIDTILNSINYLVDGPYIEELHDATLPLRGSSNQRVINIKEFDFS